MRIIEKRYYLQVLSDIIKYKYLSQNTKAVNEKEQAQAKENRAALLALSQTVSRRFYDYGVWINEGESIELKDDNDFLSDTNSILTTYNEIDPGSSYDYLDLLISISDIRQAFEEGGVIKKVNRKNESDSDTYLCNFFINDQQIFRNWLPHNIPLNAFKNIFDDLNYHYYTLDAYIADDDHPIIKTIYAHGLVLFLMEKGYSIYQSENGNSDDMFEKWHIRWTWQEEDRQPTIFGVKSESPTPSEIENSGDSNYIVEQ